MKRTIILLFTILFCLMSHAQTEKFVRTYKYWITQEFSDQYYSSPEFEYETPKETSFSFFEFPYTFNGKEYYKVVNNRDHITALAYLREKESKVYTYIEKENAEYLFYNFAAIEGDEFDIYVDEDNKQCHCLVTKADSVVIDNQKLKRITFNVKGDTFAEKEEVWIDVLGRLGDPLYNVSLNQSNIPDPQLLCITDHNNSLYITQPVNEKHFKGQRLTDSHLIDFDSMMREPFMIKANAHFEKDTLCFNGTVKAYLSGCDYVFCSEDKDNNIYITFRNYGLPWETGTISEVSFRIPGYADGVYKITDLDGTHELVCGDVPDNIKPVVQEKDTDSYDIQGRKRNDDARGIIIKDGRKVLKQ